MGIGAMVLLVLAAPPATAADEKAAHPHDPLAFLIGDWQLGFGGEGAPDPAPTMSFRWGAHKTLIRHRGMRPENGALVPEFEGIIAWHGVEKRLVFLTAYGHPGKQVVEDGWIEVLPDGAVRRHMRVHYEEGNGLPWSDGAKAGPGGHTLEFRQTWRKVDDDHMRGTFVMKRGGVWVAPDFGHPLPAAGIPWRRIAPDPGISSP